MSIGRGFISVIGSGHITTAHSRWRMPMIRRSRQVSSPHPTPTQPSSRLAKRKAIQTLAHAARVMAPALVALTFAGVAHAQGTMDFSGATTLMGAFKTFAIYAGAVI